MKTKILMALLAGTTLFAACSGSGNYNATDSARSDSASTVPVKLVKTAEMKFKVKNVVVTAEQISKLTLSVGGMVMHHDMQTQVISKQDINLGNDSVKKLTVFNTAADMTLKIPAEFAEPFMDSLNHLGLFIDNRKMVVEDRSLDHLATRLKAKNREVSVAMRKHIKLTQGGADTMLNISDDVVDRKISNLRTDEAAKFTTLSLYLYQGNTVSKEVVANDDLSTYNASLRVQTGLAFSNGWQYFSRMMIGILHLWAFILLGGAIGLGVWYYNKRKKGNKTIPAD